LAQLPGIFIFFAAKSDTWSIRLARVARVLPA
jgi:hypothetical protein